MHSRICMRRAGYTLCFAPLSSISSYFSRKGIAALHWLFSVSSVTCPTFSVVVIGRWLYVCVCNLSEFRSVGHSKQCWDIGRNCTARLAERWRLSQSVWSESVWDDWRHNDVSAAGQEDPRTYCQHVEQLGTHILPDICTILCVQIRHWSIHWCFKVWPVNISEQMQFSWGSIYKISYDKLRKKLG